ncbi:MAG: hypothetical protein KDB40_15100 [Acidimicrobiales bacterium]|nr:hypothetical protein [Acidimicrobiales bacterium]MCB9394736.1 hypothetical protein [Acidimicrobiaceae bacterium]
MSTIRDATDRRLDDRTTSWGPRRVLVRMIATLVLLAGSVSVVVTALESAG